MKLWHQMRAFARHWSTSAHQATQLVPRPSDDMAQGSLLVVAEGPLPMAEMYVDVLRGQGLPAMLRSSGAGRGAFGGGAGVEGQVLVPAAMLARARDVLGIEESGEGSDQGEQDERKDGDAR